jgi:hypothetical protein
LISQKVVLCSSLDFFVANVACPCSSSFLHICFVANVAALLKMTSEMNPNVGCLQRWMLTLYFDVSYSIIDNDLSTGIHWCKTFEFSLVFFKWFSLKHFWEKNILFTSSSC